MANINFEYFTAAEAGQYTFYRIPKALFTDGRFRDLSCEAKVLYGMMLDRMGLSIKNGWLDSVGRVYIVYTVEDVMAVMGCGTQKAVRLVKELDTAEGIGLIEKKRVGLGRPNRFYVKNFMAKESGGTDAHGGVGQEISSRQEHASVNGKEKMAAGAQECTREQAADGATYQETSGRQERASINGKEGVAAGMQEGERAAAETVYTEDVVLKTSAGCVAMPEDEKAVEKEICAYEHDWWETEADFSNAQTQMG